MIALDTNGLIRLLIEDDETQARKVKKLVESVEKQSQQIIIMTEVLIETVWVLESVYGCTREDISGFLETMIHTSIFTFSDPLIIRNVIHHFKRAGDFADLVIVMQALNHQEKKIFSFDKKLQKAFPDCVVEKISPNDL